MGGLCCRCSLLSVTSLLLWPSAIAIVIAGRKQATAKIHPLCAVEPVYRTQGLSVTPEICNWNATIRGCSEPRPIFEKSATRFLRLAHPTRERTQNGKVRVALFCDFAEYFWTHRMLWLFCRPMVPQAKLLGYSLRRREEARGASAASSQQTKQNKPNTCAKFTLS